MRVPVLLTASISILAAGAIVAPASPAKPTGSGPGCTDGAVCVWSKPNYEGKKVVLTHTGGVSNKLAKVMNNRASSFKVRSEEVVFLYDKRHAMGEARCGYPGFNVPTLIGQFSFNNRASSSRISDDKNPACI